MLPSVSLIHPLELQLKLDNSQLIPCFESSHLDLAAKSSLFVLPWAESERAKSDSTGRILILLWDIWILNDFKVNKFLWIV